MKTTLGLDSAGNANDVDRIDAKRKETLNLILFSLLDSAQTLAPFYVVASVRSPPLFRATGRSPYFSAKSTAILIQMAVPSIQSIR
jgi:hypothetical protein